MELYKDGESTSLATSTLAEDGETSNRIVELGIDWAKDCYIFPFAADELIPIGS